MWVKLLKGNLGFTQGKWYEVIGNANEFGFVKDDKGNSNGFCPNNATWFDLTNPLPYNPDTVVGLKELPNDGKTYAKAKGTFHMKSDNRVFLIEGLWYKNTGKDLYHTEIDENHSFERIVLDFFSEIGSVENVKPAKQVWETCRETMWDYDSENEIETIGYAVDKQDESLRKLTKHLNALAYLSEVARRCNGDRVVDFADWSERKYTVIREWNYLKVEWYTTKFNQIAFLDEEARDHSFEVDKHIWNDYYGLSNE